MKNPLLIIIGAFTTLIIVLIWVYLMFFTNGTENQNIFTNFFNGETDTTIVSDPIFIPETTINLDREPLRQLTTRPVAGFAEITLEEFGTTTQALYYVESGTGHLYSINTETGEEERLSGTTFAQTALAEISSDGKYVALAAYTNTKSKRLFVGELDEAENDLISIFETEVLDFFISNKNELLYTHIGDRGLVASSFDLETRTKSNLFSLPFFEANVIWGSSANETHYVYPKTSYELEGFLYEVSGSRLKRLPIGGYGFAAVVGETHVLFSKIKDQKNFSSLYNIENKKSTPVNLNFLVDKCIVTTDGLVFICSFDRSASSINMPDAWYQGTVDFKDSIWLLNPETLDELSPESMTSGAEIINASNESGRNLDIIKLYVDTMQKNIFFINKNDNSFWMYEL